MCYLTNGANVEAVASELFVHRNTVRYRLNRAEELMGHRITRIGDVELALRYVELFGVGADPTNSSPQRRGEDRWHLRQLGRYANSVSRRPVVAAVLFETNHAGLGVNDSSPCRSERGAGRNGP